MFCCFNKEYYFHIKLKVLESLLINSIYSIKPTVWNVCAKPLVTQWQHTEFQAKCPDSFQDLQIEGKCGCTMFPFLSEELDHDT